MMTASSKNELIDWEAHTGPLCPEFCYDFYLKTMFCYIGRNVYLHSWLG